MFDPVKTIINKGDQSLVPEICFHPSGKFFAATYQHNQCVVLFDAQRLEQVRVFDSETAGFDQPHGVLLTENHLLVSNSHNFQRPSVLLVFRLDSDSSEPVCRFETPLEALREAHSLAYDSGRLVATYCERPSRRGMLVSYAFDDETGTVSGPVDFRETVFHDLGDTKGVSFLDHGHKVIVSFNSAKVTSRLNKSQNLLRGAGLEFAKQGFQGVMRKIVRRLQKIQSKQEAKPVLKNGMAVFAIDADGRFSEQPDQLLIREQFCRLENVFCQGKLCVLVDTINQRVMIYDMLADPQLSQPLETLNVEQALPHGAKLSPDGKLLVISCFSLEVWNQEIQWNKWRLPRQDNLLIYQLQEA